MEPASFAFASLSFIALVLSGILATRQYPVSAAMVLISKFIVLAGMFGLLEAHFSAAAQVIVYAGAIMVVFVFVIMLLNIPEVDMTLGKLSPFEIAAVLLSLLFTVVLGTDVGAHVLSPFQKSQEATWLPVETSQKTITSVASLMFTDYLWAFELMSFLILAACIGAVVIGKKRVGDIKHA